MPSQARFGAVLWFLHHYRLYNGGLKRPRRTTSLQISGAERFAIEATEDKTILCERVNQGVRKEGGVCEAATEWSGGVER